MTIVADTSVTVLPTGTWSIDPVWSALEFEVKKIGLVADQGPRAGLLRDDPKAETTRRSRVRSTLTASRRSTRLATRTFSRRTSSTRSATRSFASSRLPSATDGDDLVVEGRPDDQGHHQARSSSRAAIVGAGVDPCGNDRIGIELGRAPSTAPTSGSNWNAPLPGGELPAPERGRAQGRLRGGQRLPDDEGSRHLRQPPRASRTTRLSRARRVELAPEGVVRGSLRRPGAAPALRPGSGRGRLRDAPAPALDLRSAHRGGRRAL